MFKSGNKVRVKDSVLRKVKIAAEILGCTVEEFVNRASEREAEKALSLMSGRDPISSAEVDSPLERPGSA